MLLVKYIFLFQNSHRLQSHNGRSKESVTMTYELILSQEDETQIHQSTHTICCRTDHFFSQRSLLEATPIYWRSNWSNQLCSSKQLLNDVIFLWFTDKNLLALATKIYIISNCTHLWQQRSNTSQQNAIFTQEWRWAIRWWRINVCVKIWLHRFHITWSRSKNQ